MLVFIKSEFMHTDEPQYHKHLTCHNSFHVAYIPMCEKLNVRFWKSS